MHEKPRQIAAALALLATAVAVLVALLIVPATLRRPGHGGAAGSASGTDPLDRELQQHLADGTTAAAWVLFDSTVSVERSTRDRNALTRRLEHAGAQIRFHSRWLNAISVDLDSATAQRIAALPHVARIQRVGWVYAAVPHAKPAATPARAPADPAGLALNDDSARYGPNYRALVELGIPQAHGLNFSGRNVRIGIIDTGFETTHEAFAGLRVIATRDFIHGDDNVRTQTGDAVSARDQEIHGTWVWSLLAGNRPGQLLGPAYGSEFLLAKVDLENAGHEQFAADEDRWVSAVEWMEQNRARIINSSLSFRFFMDRSDYTDAQLNGNTAISTRIADQAAGRGILIVTAVGNWPTGPAPLTSLSAPADADSVLSVGAVDSSLQVHPQSGRGPTSDGRIKPEVVARGTNLYAADSHIPAGYEVVPFGTSLAAPLVTGSVALLMEAWPNLTAMAIRDAIMRSGSGAQFPNSSRGHGIPNVASAILFPQGLSPAGVATIDLNGVLTTIAPTFRWEAPLVHAQLRPVRYQLEVATDPQFQTIIYQDTVNEAFSLQVRTAFRPRPSLWWRVVARSFTGVERVSATSGPIQMPNWVRLTTFDNPQGSIVGTTRPVFQWEPLLAPEPAGPLTYDVQVLNATTGAIVQTLRNISTGAVTAQDPLVPNNAYRWRVIARSRIGIADTVTSRGTFVVTSDAQPPMTQLYAPFPNPFPRDPFAPSIVRFWFDLSQRSPVTLAVYNARGLLVKNLIPASSGCGAVTLDSGQYGRGDAVEADPCVQTFWDGRDEQGREMPRGVYIARLRAGGTTATQRIVFLPSGP